MTQDCKGIFENLVFFFEPAQNMNVIRMLFFFRVKRKKKREGKILTQVKEGGEKRMWSKGKLNKAGTYHRY